MQLPKQLQIENDPDGIRTRVMALKGPCPRPTRRQDRKLFFVSNFHFINNKANNKPHYATN